MFKYKVIHISSQEFFLFDEKKDIYERLKNIIETRGDLFNKDDYIIEKNNCFGCLNDKLDQRSHSECPDGCLHNTEFCDFCSK